MITIEEFMTQDPYTLTLSDTIEDARQIMTERHIRHIPVTDKQHRLLGLVTQRDVLAATEPQWIKDSLGELSPDDSRLPLSEIMIKNVSVIHCSDSLRQAAIYLQEHKYGCLPVVQEGRLIGIITDSDFISIAINLLEQVELSEDAFAEDDVVDENELLTI